MVNIYQMFSTFQSEDYGDWIWLVVRFVLFLLGGGWLYTEELLRY